VSQPPQSEMSTASIADLAKLLSASRLLLSFSRSSSTERLPSPALIGVPPKQRQIGYHDNRVSAPTWAIKRNYVTYRLIGHTESTATVHW
jgi:hypothetical protein